MEDGNCKSSIDACNNNGILNSSLVPNEWCKCVGVDMLKVESDLTEGTCNADCPNDYF